MILYQIYELTPAPWGVRYRFIVQYDSIDAAEILLRCLNKLDTMFNSYKIIAWEE